MWTAFGKSQPRITLACDLRFRQCLYKVAVNGEQQSFARVIILKSEMVVLQAIAYWQHFVALKYPMRCIQAEGIYG